MLSIEEFKAVFDAAPDGFVIVDADGTIRAANPKIEEMFGWGGGDLEGRAVETLLPEALAAAHEGHRASFTRNPHNRPMGAGLDLRARRRDGSEFPVEISLSPWRRDEGDVQIICSVRDISAVHRLKNFSEGALRASEDERQRIARELHDDTAQRLATLILRVRTLAAQSDDVRRGRLFEEVRQEIVDAADGVKRMARGLRPPELEELGLVLALHAHARTLREAGVFRVFMELDAVDAYLDVTAKLALYRIIQEAISNARRHSGADSASVTLGIEEGSIVATISDRGKGFTLGTAVDGQRGLGLIGMQERATMIGGRISMESTPDGGTRVRVMVPTMGETTEVETMDG